jgi:20S proteasome alpha/beta subunit
MWIEPFPEPTREGVPSIRRVPWERSEVTVCIAAICQIHFDPIIVCCTDSRGSSPLGKTDNFPKSRNLGKNWVNLSAGTASEITTLTRLLAKSFSDEAGVIDESNLAGVVQRAVTSRKNQKATEHVGAKFGISYQDFIDTGKEKFPPDIFREHIHAIRNLQIPVEMVICGFTPNIPLLCKLNQDGQISLQDHFAVCGEGEYLASSVLYHREQNEYLTLERTLYNVYEAKKYAERVPSVGELTGLFVLNQHGKRRVSEDIKARLDKIFVDLGPKPVPDDFTLSGDIFDENW